MLGLPRAAGEVTRIIRGETSTDDDGFQTPAETQETLYSFLDIPTVSEPSHGAAEVDVAEATLYLQPGTAVDAKDLFLIDGTRFEVVGIAPVNRNVFTGAIFYTEVRVRRRGGCGGKEKFKAQQIRF